MATVAPRDLQAAMFLADALARFLVQLQADGRSPHTIAQYARHVRRFGAWLEAKGLPDDVAAFELCSWSGLPAGLRSRALL